MQLGTDHYASLGAGAGCDICSSTMSRNTRWYNCRKCEYDLCIKCGDMKRGGEAVFVNVSVVDSGVFTEIGKKKLPPRLPTMLFLEDEVFKPNPQQELYFPDEYIQLLFQGDPNILDKDIIRTFIIYIYIYIECVGNLDLLLGVQGWRRYIFTDNTALETIKFHLDPEMKDHGARLVGATNSSPPDNIFMERGLDMDMMECMPMAFGGMPMMEKAAMFGES